MVAFDPAESEIEFAQSSGGMVHVVVPLLEDDDLVGGADVRMPFVEWFKVRTLCGFILYRSTTAAIWKFDDDLICMRCYRSMGSYSNRLFQHER